MCLSVLSSVFQVHVYNVIQVTIEINNLQQN